MRELGFPIGTFRVVFAWLCHYIYWFISVIFELFVNVSKVTVLGDDSISQIYQRVTLILTIIMVFYVTLEFVKYVVQPDMMTDKEKGASKIISKMLIVVVLIAFVPNIFGYAYKLQSAVIDRDVLSKVILGYGGTPVSERGNEFAYNLFKIFYRFDASTWGEDANCGEVKCQRIVNMNYNSLSVGDGLPNIEYKINAADNVLVDVDGEQQQVLTPKIYFKPLFAVLVGLFIAYILILYVIDIGARVIQLMFLQIIAPIPIIGYLAPKKDGIFQKWVKQCVTTYLDLFIRLLIIYLMLFFCNILLGAIENHTLLNNISESQNKLIIIVLILGLLMFAHRAPKMLQELFPKMGAASGDFGFKPGERPGVARAVGATLGATTGLRTMVGRGINRAKRNRFNKEYREGAENDYETANKNYEKIKSRRRSLKNAKFDKSGKTYKYTDENGKIKNLTEAEYAKMVKDTRKEQRDALVERDSAKAYMKNTKYRSTLGAAAAGLIGGTVRGAATGAKLSKIEKFGDIRKQMQEVEKNENTKTAAVEKWYDEGGYSTPSRVLSGVEQRMGITTTYGRMQREIQKIDSSIKSNERLIANESAVKSKQDVAKDRSGSKIEAGEQKTHIAGTTLLQITELDGNTKHNIEIPKTGGTTSDVYAEYKEKTLKARADADAMAQAVQNKTTELIIKNGSTDQSTWSQADQDTLKMVTEQHEKLEAEAKVAADRQGKVKKALQEYAITRILEEKMNGRDPRQDKQFDGVLIGNVEDELTSIAETTRDESTREYMRNHLSNQEYADYMSGRIISFEQMDKIQTALINCANDRTRQNVELKGSKTRLETSSNYDARKADDTAAGGKK